MSGIASKVKDVLTGRDQTRDPRTDTTDTTHRHGAPATTGSGTATTDATTTNPTSGAYRSDIPHQHDRRGDTEALGTRTAGTAGKTGLGGGYGSHQDSTNQGLHHTMYSDQANNKHTGGGAYTSGTTYAPGSTTQHAPVTSDRDRHQGVTAVGVPGSTDHHTTAGPHRTDVGNKVDPRIDSDLDGSTTLRKDRTTTTAGPHSSDLANKLDPRVDSDLDGSTTLGGRDRTTTTAGPHRTNVNNKLDPRVDSDLDGSTTLGRDRTTTTAGPHRSDIGNKVDPRVDSDRDGSATLGGRDRTTTTAGPHRTDLSNKVDPRVDSDLDGSTTLGRDRTTTAGNDYNQHRHHAGDTTGPGGYTTSTTRATAPTTTATTSNDHNPRHHPVGGTTGPGGYTTSAATTTAPPRAITQCTGPAPNTAGPHRFDILNKLDPRVDSNLDGSKTITIGKGGTTDTTHHQH